MMLGMRLLCTILLAQQLLLIFSLDNAYCDADMPNIVFAYH